MRAASLVAAVLAGVAGGAVGLGLATLDPVLLAAGAVGLPLAALPTLSRLFAGASGKTGPAPADRAASGLTVPLGGIAGLLIGLAPVVGPVVLAPAAVAPVAYLIHRDASAPALSRR